jgi:LmbE family N-acetylglucosaminyl deacetylase
MPTLSSNSDSPAHAESPRALCFGAHPDDLEFGAGGVLLALAEAGWHLQLVVASRGEAGTNGDPETRTREASAAASQLGAELHWVDFGGDAHMEKSLAYTLEAARLIRETRPDLVLAPTTVATQHPDHAVVGAIVRDALRLARYGKVDELLDLKPWAAPRFYQYAIGASAEPAAGNRVVIDVSVFKDAWEQLMGQHASQMKTRNYVDAQIARARALGLSSGVEYAQLLHAEDQLILSTPVDLPATARAL